MTCDWLLSCWVLFFLIENGPSRIHQNLAFLEKLIQEILFRLLCYATEQVGRKEQIKGCKH